MAVFKNKLWAIKDTVDMSSSWPEPLALDSPLWDQIGKMGTTTTTPKPFPPPPLEQHVRQGGPRHL